MNLRCVFHVSPASTVQTKAARERLESSEEALPEATAAAASPAPGSRALETQAETQPQRPRGRSFETWSRARGWASED